MSDKKKILGYKVRNTKTGLFLSSVSRDKWTKIGKVWPRKSDAFRAINSGLKTLNRYRKYNGNKVEKIFEEALEWELVELSEEYSKSFMFYINKLKI